MLSKLLTGNTEMETNRPVKRIWKKQTSRSRRKLTTTTKKLMVCLYMRELVHERGIYK